MSQKGSTSPGSWRNLNAEFIIDDFECNWHASGTESGFLRLRIVGHNARLNYEEISNAFTTYLAAARDLLAPRLRRHSDERNIAGCSF